MTVDDGTWSPPPIGRVAAPLRDQVLEVVRQGILDSRLRPGQRLVERELMEQLGVSRATVREVIARLASEGLVTNIPQRGAIVAVLTGEEAADIYEMRASLEVLATQRFIERVTPAQVAELRAAFDAFAAAAEDGSLDQLAAKDAFYRVLFDGAASAPLTQVITMLQSRVRLLRRTSLSAPGRARETVGELRVLVEAIEAKDSEAAAEACARHVRNAARTALTRMAGPGTTARPERA